MNGKKTCATCKYFIPLTMMKREERFMFINDCDILGIIDFENYGYCKANDDNIVIRRKDDGNKCKSWRNKYDR